MAVDGTKGAVSDFFVAVLGALLSFGMACLCLGGMFSNGDPRLILTVSETMGNLADVRDILKNTANYSLRDNPVGISHVPFPSVVETLQEVEDLERRGLINQQQVQDIKRSGLFNASAERSILKRLMVASWCSSGPGIKNTLPAERTPGCRCIADAYLEFVKTDRPPGNGTAVASIDTRDRVSSQVYRCWDQRLVRRSRACGEVCKTNLVGLPFFANVILFLACTAFLIFTNIKDLGWSYFQGKLILLITGGVLCLPYYVEYAESNVLNMTGVVLCIYYLVVSLDKELDDRRDDRKGNGLVLCVLVILPLVMSAHGIQMGVSGYGRDVWVSLSFGVASGILGVILQVRLVCGLFLLFTDSGDFPALLLGYRRLACQECWQGAVLRRLCAAGCDQGFFGLRLHIRSSPFCTLVCGISFLEQPVQQQQLAHPDYVWCLLGAAPPDGNFRRREREAE